MLYQDVVCAFLVDWQEDSATAVPPSDGATPPRPFRLLCAQRHQDAEHFANLYEFPGGKVDPGETHRQALQRECREELGVEVDLMEFHEGAASAPTGDADILPAYTFHHKPKHDRRLGGLVTFRLFFYWAQIRTVPGQTAKKPQALASQRVVWLTPQEMAGLTFCPGDEGIIEDMASGTLYPGSSARASP